MMNAQASRHRGTEARSAASSPSLSPGRGEGESAVRRGFSLIEVLLAIFILGIGVISIAAIFPAGIAQQRLSNDDLMGPLVANHAMSVLRSKVRPEDFGTIEEFAQFAADLAGVPNRYVSPTIPGDWGWMRPGILLEDDTDTTRFNERGALDIFSHRRIMGLHGWQAPANASEVSTGWPGTPGNIYPPWLYNIPGDTVLHGIPFSSAASPAPGSNPPIPPFVVVTQGERYYPMQQEVGQGSGLNAPRLQQRPQYVWECMFRRYEGRIHVAIFVYRVHVPGTTGADYRTPPNPINAQQPFLPYRLNLAGDFGTDPWSAGAGAPSAQQGSWITGSNANTYDPRDLADAWQESRQWLLDQNNNVHRVLGNRRNDNVMEIELTRGVEPVLGWGNTFNGPSATPNWYQNPGIFGTPGLVYPNVVTDIWYLPREMQIDTTDNGEGDTWVTVTPIYITVKEL